MLLLLLIFPYLSSILISDLLFTFICILIQCIYIAPECNFVASVGQFVCSLSHSGVMDYNCVIHWISTGKIYDWIHISPLPICYLHYITLYAFADSVKTITLTEACVHLRCRLISIIITLSVLARRAEIISKLKTIDCSLYLKD